MKAERVVQILLNSLSVERAEATRVATAVFSELSGPSAEMIAAGWGLRRGDYSMPTDTISKKSGVP